ncbi:response regulator transcription factor [Geodermatophilus amargosae]|uniref:response regulator transcription factor n=1 Tax=Geodermatophilus amargosae TaxID=1296565 RepID=UPI0034E018A4
MRVVIGEDEALVRTGLTHVMQAAGFDVVAAVGDAHELVRSAEEHVPDIVVTDIRMPPDHRDAGLRAAVEIRRGHPGIAVLVLSQHLQRAYAVELLGDRPSGVGYLLKQRIADIDTFTDDVRRIAAGGTVLDPEVVGLVVARARGHHDALDRLTPRQQQVLALMSEGRTNASIARTLSITERAVVQHTSHIYDEFGLALSDDDHRRVLAVIRYLSS